jgi:hypothetical protein
MVWELVRLMWRSYRVRAAALIVAAAAWMSFPSDVLRLDGIADFASRQFGVWSESTCARNRVACLMAKQAQLNGLHAALADAVTVLAERKGKVSRDSGDRERKLMDNTVLLEEGRRLHGPSLAQKTVHFNGRDYAPDVLERRLESLNDDTRSLQTLVRQAKALDEAVDRKLKDLLVKKELVRAARDLLPPLIELVQANSAFGDIDAVLRDLAALSNGADATLAEVRDVDDWLKATAELIRRKDEAARRSSERS